MSILLLILCILAAGLVVFFWAGTFFFQGYIYTEPTPGLYWQAPAAGLAAGVFLALWCFAVANADKAGPSNIPYDTFFHFSPKVDMVDVPVKELWAHKKGGQVVHYVRKREGQTRYRYVDTTYDQRPWNNVGVEAIEVETLQKQKVRLVLQPSAGKGTNRAFVSDDGWVMEEFVDSSLTSGPTGLPWQFRTGRFLANLFFNFGFLAVLFLGLWLLLRYQWSHALGIALVLWVVFTLMLLPMLLDYAARVAQQRTPPAPPAPAALAPRHTASRVA